ncbi:hypothetical protein [Niastella vici]|nr:hypothetical protein [Niastella vici]
MRLFVQCRYAYIEASIPALGKPYQPAPCAQGPRSVSGADAVIAIG